MLALAEEKWRPTCGMTKKQQILGLAFVASYKVTKGLKCRKRDFLVIIGLINNNNRVPDCYRCFWALFTLCLF